MNREMENDVVKLESCPVCGHQSFRTIATPGNWIGQKVFTRAATGLALKKCTQCSLEFINPRPASHLLETFYSGDTYTCHRPDDSSTAVGKARFLLSFIAGQVTKEGPLRFLDFGAGGGFLLRHAQAAGWRATGFDVGRAALESCRAQGLDATGDLGTLEPGSFDAIILNHVFEHLEDHVAVLKGLYPLLAPRGRLFVETPNVKSLRARLSPGFASRYLGFDQRHRAFPIHLFYFSPKTLPLAVAQGGFRIRAVATSGLGLEELRKAPDQAAPSPVERTSPPPDSQLPAPTGQSAPSGLKALIKKLYFGQGLGENVIVVASR